MSVQRLAPRTLRRITRRTGVEVLRGWANGGYVYAFVTPDHRHGYVDKRDWIVKWAAEGTLMHYTSCQELFVGYYRFVGPAMPTLLRPTTSRTEGD